MRSSNPVLSREGSFGSPSRWGTETNRLTMDDVVVKTATTFGVLALTAAVAWALNLGIGVMAVAGIAAFVIALVATFKRTTSPALVLAYAALEGVVIGVLSHVYETAYNGIIVQAVLGVTLVFGVMLGLYKSGLVKVNSTFLKVVMAAAIGFFVLSLLDLGARLFTPTGLGLYAGGPLAIGFAVLGVVLGAAFYATDFSQAEQLVRAGVPQKEAWRVAFGLTLTTVFVYVNLLRLIGYLRN